MAVTSAPDLFPRPFRLHHHTASRPNLYIYDAIATSAGIAASASDHSIGVLDPSSLATTHTIQYHTDQITNIRSKDQRTLLTSSRDSQIALWDLRQPPHDVPAIVFKSQDRDAAILGFDVSPDGMMLVSGASVDEQDMCARIALWDTRQPHVAAGLFDSSHSEDITQIHCHPTRPGQFMSGSSDGLLCTFDVSQTLDEEDALGFAANTGSSVSRCGYFGPESQYMFAQSDMETLQLWTSDAALLVDFGDIRDMDSVEVDYIVGCQYDSQSQRLYMAAGTNRGSVHLLHVGAESFEYVQKLEGGHQEAIVRSINWDLEQGWCLTGGEDGRVALWKQ